MPHVPHQTTPFRRPSSSWPQDLRPDPAEVGTAFGLELCLAAEGDAADAGAAPHQVTSPDGDVGQRTAMGAPTLCP
jgi:hypothetical protein